MYSFQFEYIIREFDESILNKGIYLSIVHANKIPPHIGVVVDGKYFSLKAKGKDENVPVKELLRILNRKNIVSLFVSISIDLSNEKVLQVFDGFEKAIAYESSCLSPVKQLFELGEGIQMLGDLLNELAEKKLISLVYGCNVLDDYKGIPKYNINAIHERLEILASKSKQHV